MIYCWNIIRYPEFNSASLCKVLDSDFRQNDKPPYPSRITSYGASYSLIRVYSFPIRVNSCLTNARLCYN